MRGKIDTFQLENARHMTSEGSRGGGSKWCRHDLGCRTKSKNLRVSCYLRTVRLVSPTRHWAFFTVCFYHCYKLICSLLL